MHRPLTRALRACLLFVSALVITGSAFAQTPANEMFMADFIVPPGSAKKIVVRGAARVATGATLQLDLVGPGSAPIAGAPLDQATVSALPIFSHSTSARETALLFTLNPGSYTATLSHLYSAQDTAVIEVYDVTGSSFLLHSSLRGYFGGTNSQVLDSFTLPQSGGARRLLFRAVGPGLSALNISNGLPDPNLTIMNMTQQTLGSNEDWSATDLPVMTQVGAFPFAQGSKDAALVMDLQPGSYSGRVGTKVAAPGAVLFEIYDVTSAPPLVAGALSVKALATATASTHSAPAEIVFSRTGALDQPLTITYALSGTATAGLDYSGLSGTATFATNSANVSAFVTALASAATDGSKTVVATLSSQSGYNVDAAANSVSVQLFYGQGTLYVANLQPPSGVKSSGSGSASVLLTPDERGLVLNLNFSGLTSAETSAYLRLSNAGEDGLYLVRFPQGSPSTREWIIQPSGGLSVADIVAALKAGKVYVSLGSENFPSGELRGTFLVSNGNPGGNPGGGTDPLTPESASRFLQQATFGPTKTEIDDLVAKGFDAWFAEQLAAPRSSHLEAAQADFTAFNTNATLTRPQGSNRQAAWWKIALTGPDQLRQRVAFALSEIFVISDVNGTVGNWQDGAANYYDVLAKDALGNFRTLLEDVTLNPMMGIYLSYIRNSKATATTQPDENYAREVMQLFTIGLNQLNPDGTLKLNGNVPIPTYDQKTITEMAKVFTGWQFYNAAPTKNNFRSGGGVSSDYLQPMTLNPNFHEDAAKTIVGGIQLPANQGGAKDLADTLDALFNHPNTAPFICRQLIQRLVTSNPSSGYIYRVAQVFANNGNGVRGDLAAVVKAILTDPEARSAQTAQGANYGKLKEPLLRVSALLRALKGAADNGRYAITNPEGALSQAALRSPTVFNFFEPNYVVPGDLARAGLYAPEFQILTDTTAISVPNNLYGYIFATRGATTIGLDLTVLPPTSPASGLVDYLNLVFCAGSMTQAERDRIVTALTAMPKTATDLDKYRAAIYLTVSTQAAAIQK